MSPLGPLVAKLMSGNSLRKSLTKVFSKAHPPTKEFVHERWKLTSENNGISLLPRLIRFIEERRTYRERWVLPLVNAVVRIRLINGIEDPVAGKHTADLFFELVPMRRL